MSRIIPICASCKKIQQSDGYWREVESFRHKYAHMDFTYSLCPSYINTPLSGPEGGIAATKSQAD
jgi:hypothetical protein